MLKAADAQYKKARKQVLYGDKITDRTIYELNENYRIPEKINAETGRRGYKVNEAVYLRHEDAIQYYMRRTLDAKTDIIVQDVVIAPIIKTLLKIAENHILPLYIAGGGQVQL